jgi:hypothetical protein
MFDCPPQPTCNKCTREREIYYQPDHTAHSQPVQNPNKNYPVPGIVLACLLDECQYSRYSEAGIAQWIDKIDNAPEPFPACILVQIALLSLVQ